MPRGGRRKKTKLDSWEGAPSHQNYWRNEVDMDAARKACSIQITKRLKQLYEHDIWKEIKKCPA